MLRLRGAGPGLLWAAAWTSFLGSGLGHELGARSPALPAVAALWGTLAPTLLLAGARAQRGAPTGGILALGCAVGVARGLASHQGSLSFGAASALVYDPLVVLAAAWTLLPRAGPATPSERALPIALLVVAALEATTGLGLSAETPAVAVGWAVVAPLTWLLQITLLGERDRAETVRAGDDRFRALTENVRELVAELDAEGRILYASPRHVELGIDATGKSLADLMPAAQAERARAWVEAAAAGGETRPQVWRTPWRGEERWLESAVRGFRTSTGERRVVVSTRDVTERRRTDRARHKAHEELESRVAERTRALALANERLAEQVTERERAEQAARASEERYRRIAGLASDYCYALRLDGAGTVEWLRGGYRELVGYDPEEMGRGLWREAVLPEDFEQLRRRVQALVASGDGSLADVSYRLRTAEGELRWFREHWLVERDAAGTFRLYGAGRDVTAERQAQEERRALEARLYEAQRQQSLGLMASGIAHDFNNLLMPILGHSALALQELGADSPLRSRVERIHRASDYAAGLVRQLLTFAGGSDGVQEVIDLSALVEEMVGVLDTAVSKRGHVETELAPGLPPLEGDPTRIRQVAMNLVTNAAEALGDEGGTIRVSTRAVDADAALLSRTALGDAPPPGRYIELRVRDDGCGMPPETRQRIFDPFFTTKFSGRGLGLAAAAGIVRSHGGAVLVESAPGAGTTMRVLLPVATAPTRAAAPAQPAPAASDPSPRAATVLVVDDEEAVREIAREYLERAGFRVREAGSGREARAALVSPGASVDCVVLDLLMPDEGGGEVLAWLAREHPALPVVLASGHGEDRLERLPGEARPAAFVRKPYGPEELQAALRRALRLSGPAARSRSGGPA